MTALDGTTSASPPQPGKTLPVFRSNIRHQHHSLLRCFGTFCHSLSDRLSHVITHKQQDGGVLLGVCISAVSWWLMVSVVLKHWTEEDTKKPSSHSLHMFRICLISWCFVMQTKNRLKLNAIIQNTENGHTMQIRLAQVLYIRFSLACVLVSICVSVESCYCIDSLVSLSVTSTSLSGCLHGSFVPWCCDVCSFET